MHDMNKCGLEDSETHPRQENGGQCYRTSSRHHSCKMEKTRTEGASGEGREKRKTEFEVV